MAELEERVIELEEKVEALQEMQEMHKTIREALLGNERTRQPGLIHQFCEMTDAVQKIKTQITFYVGALSVLVVTLPIFISFVLYNIIK